MQRIVKISKHAAKDKQLYCAFFVRNALLQHISHLALNDRVNCVGLLFRPTREAMNISQHKTQQHIKENMFKKRKEKKNLSAPCTALDPIRLHRVMIGVGADKGTINQ